MEPSSLVFTIQFARKRRADMISGQIFVATGDTALNESIFEEQMGCLWRKK
jgi:hypothetical protein